MSWCKSSTKQRRNRFAKEFSKFAHIEKLDFGAAVGFRVGDIRDGIRLEDVPDEIKRDIATHEVYEFRDR